MTKFMTAFMFFVPPQKDRKACNAGFLFFFLLLLDFQLYSCTSFHPYVSQRIHTPRDALHTDPPSIFTELHWLEVLPPRQKAKFCLCGESRDLSVKVYTRSGTKIFTFQIQPDQVIILFLFFSSLFLMILFYSYFAMQLMVFVQCNMVLCRGLSGKLNFFIQKQN